MKKSTPEAYEKILNHYGALPQLAKMAEECSELAAKINKYLGLKLFDPTTETAEIEEEIIKEIADVENVLPQMRIVFESGRIDRVKDEKIMRTFERMEK